MRLLILRQLTYVNEKECTTEIEFLVPVTCSSKGANQELNSKIVTTFFFSFNLSTNKSLLSKYASKKRAAK